jgi:hypothetical protein
MMAIRSCGPHGVSRNFEGEVLVGIACWIDEARDIDRPRKSDQDKPGFACLCLLVALHLAEGSESA